MLLLIKKIRNALEKHGYALEGRAVYPSTKEGFHLTINIYPLLKQQKTKGKSPEELGEKVKEVLSRLKGVEKVESVKGYVNVLFSLEELVDSLKAFSFEKKKKSVVIEYPSVNPNKPWHVGHLRNALIGLSLSRLLSFYGYNVISLNYINDMGLQVAQSYFYYLKNKEKIKECKKKFDHCIGEQYVELAKRFEEDKEFEKKVRELLAKMEKGEEKVKEFALEVVKAQQKTADDYGICFSFFVFESDLSLLFEKGLKLLKENKALKYVEQGELKGCYVIQALGKEKVLIRSDSTLTYVAKDIIFHLWKFGVLRGLRFSKSFSQACGEAFISSLEGEFLDKEVFPSLEWAINIVGIEQSYPQQVVKEALKKLGVKGELTHLAYAFVRLKEGHFSGRKGTWKGYTADELLEEGIKRVLEKNRDLSKEEAKKIALAAIKFAFLKVNLKKPIYFDWSILSPTGDTGVYLLYSLVRASSILRKASYEQSHKEKDFNIPSFSKQKLLPISSLLYQLSLFDYVVEQASLSLDVSKIAEYALSLSKAFHSFYSSLHVLNAPEEQREFLLYLVFTYKRIMEKALFLLGIEKVERM